VATELCYSYLRASTGLRLEAFQAGYMLDINVMAMDIDVAMPMFKRLMMGVNDNAKK